MVFLIGIAAFISTSLGGLFALRLKDRLHLILGFSAGAVIGVAFFDLMPEALQIIMQSHSAAFGTAIVATGFAVYLILDRMIVLHRHHDNEDDDEHAEKHAVRAIWGASTLSFHSFLDGLGIGLAFHVSPTIGLVVAAAVLTHDFSDGINTVNVALKNGTSRMQAFRWLMIDAIAPVIGILVTLVINVTESQLGILLAIFSGFFLYIGASDLLPESHHRHPVRWTTFATVLGMAVIFIVIRIAG
jgi:ZIP family zinc transporter